MLLLLSSVLYYGELQQSNFMQLLCLPVFLSPFGHGSSISPSVFLIKQCNHFLCRSEKSLAEVIYINVHILNF